MPNSVETASTSGFEIILPSAPPVLRSWLTDILTLRSGMARGSLGEPEILNKTA